MKKLVLTTVCVLAITGGAFAQLVNWQTFLPTGIKVETNSTAYSPLLSSTGSPVGGGVGFTAAGSGNFYYELLYLGGAQASAPTTFASLTTWLDAGAGNPTNLEATSGGSAGTIQAVNQNAGATVPWGSAVSNNILLVGWSANLGTTWLVVSNELANKTFSTVLAGQQGFFGITSTGYIASNGSSPGTTLFSNTAQSQGTPITSPLTQLYLLQTVPEPATMALVGLGGLSLMLFRRQRKN